MNYFGVTKWDQVLKVFDKGGALEGKWGWLATLRDAEVGDTISFYYDHEAYFTGTLASENGAFYISSDKGPIPLTSVEKLSWDGYQVTDAPRDPELWGMPLREPTIRTYLEATERYPVFKYDPNRFNFGNSVLDVTGAFTSLVGGNPLVYGAKAAKACTDAGRAVSIISILNSLSVDQNPNSIITSAGGFIPGPIGGGFSLAALFYDLGFYQTY